jgi:uncharacterized membrane protein
VQRSLAAALAIGALVWSAAVLLAPFALTSHIALLNAAAASVYESARLVCHQRPERSFHLAGFQLPVCARCAGLYWSAAAGAIAAWLARPGAMSARGSRFWLGVAALPTAITVAAEFFGLAYPSNVVRAISALPLGTAAAWIFVQSLRSEAPGTPGVERRAANRL